MLGGRGPGEQPEVRYVPWLPGYRIRCSQSPCQRHPAETVTDVNTTGLRAFLAQCLWWRERMLSAVQLWPNPAVTA